MNAPRRTALRVMIADDDRAFAEYLGALVTICEHQVVATVTGGGLSAIQTYTRHRPDVLLLDVLMPRFNGFTVCQQLVSRDPGARVILMSGLVAGDYPNIAASPACGYLSKPILIADLRAALDGVGAQGLCGGENTLMGEVAAAGGVDAMCRTAHQPTVLKSVARAA